MPDFLFVIVVMVLIIATLEWLGGLAGLIVVVMLVIAGLSISNEPVYYETCTASGTSYVRCFYDHVMKW